MRIDEGTRYYSMRLPGEPWLVRIGKDCLIASVDGHDTSARVVPLGDGTLNGLIAEELGIRTRDVAFEHALASALEIRA